MMSNMCSKAGIAGYKTNHSLRATAASRLYHKGIDEQLIMERTGHRSLEGVRSYKRTEEQQQIAVSNVLQQSAPDTGLQAHYAPHQKPSTAVLSGLQLYICSGITITINNNSSNTD